jgi:mannose/fructose/N-acetylgalactosamine-specific phosphotransferase system component IIC
VRRLRGGLLGIIGFLLSPLSWWNDLFINVPLALGFAWLVGLLWPAAFEAAFITGYWLTNVLGLVLLTRGAKELLAGRPSPYSRRELLKDLLVAAAYTAVIVVLIKLRVLQPLQDYGHRPDTSPAARLKNRTGTRGNPG